MPVDFAKISRILRNNAPLKVIALALAVAAWYGISKATSFEALIKDVPLHVRADEGWAVLDQSVSDVDVLFSGSLVDLRNLNRDQIVVEVDLRGKSKTGSKIMPLSSKNVRSPGGARAVRVDPVDIRISLDRESDKQVPVKADIVGSPPEGFEVERVVCTPATVVLHGPQQRLAEVDLLESEPIDLEGRIRSFQLSKPIQAPADNWSARVEPDIVRVEVTLVERSAQKEIRDVLVRALSPPESRGAVQFNPTRVTVNFDGTSDLLKGMDADNVLAFVDCAGLEDGNTVELPVRISLAPGIRSVSVVPPLVKVSIERSRRNTASSE